MSHEQGGSAPPRIALTSGERRAISVVLTKAGDGALNEDVTLDKPDADATRLLREGAATFGGRLEYLRDGVVAVAT